MEGIKESILQKLKTTEENYNVKIPLAVESGSRSWGFASPDSDYDCRFVYVHPRDWYVSLTEKKDFIEYAADAVFDVNGWDLKKFLQLMLKSNAVTFEWLSSNDIYIRDEAVAAKIREIEAMSFNPIAVSYHYLNIAKNKMNEILSEDCAKLKRYFYALRPVANLRFIWQYRHMPYMEYGRTLAEIELPAGIAEEIRELTEIKRQMGEAHRAVRNTRIIEYVQSEIDFFEAALKEMKFNGSRDYEAADEIFRAIIGRVWVNG